VKKKKERRVYLPRVLGSGQVMMPADLKRLHRYMLEIEHISVILDEVRTVVEAEWPELAQSCRRSRSIKLDTRMSAFRGESGHRLRTVRCLFMTPTGLLTVSAMEGRLMKLTDACQFGIAAATGPCINV
jgi:hypothetical protein